jgi:hypothetical protein
VLVQPAGGINTNPLRYRLHLLDAILGSARLSLPFIRDSSSGSTVDRPPAAALLGRVHHNYTAPAAGFATRSRAAPRCARVARHQPHIETSVAFMWYGGVEGGLRAKVLGRLGGTHPPSKSECSILPIARYLRAGPTMHLARASPLEAILARGDSPGIHRQALP